MSFSTVVLSVLASLFMTPRGGSDGGSCSDPTIAHLGIMLTSSPMWRSGWALASASNLTSAQLRLNLRARHTCVPHGRFANVWEQVARSIGVAALGYTIIIIVLNDHL